MSYLSIPHGKMFTSRRSAAAAAAPAHGSLSLSLSPLPPSPSTRSITTSRRPDRHCVKRPPAADDAGARRGAETDAARSCRRAPFVSGRRSRRGGCICGAFPPISAPHGAGRACRPTPHTRHRSPAHGRRAGSTIYTRCLMAFNAVFHTRRCRSAFLAYLVSRAGPQSRRSHAGVMLESCRSRVGSPRVSKRRRRSDSAGERRCGLDSVAGRRDQPRLTRPDSGCRSHAIRPGDTYPVYMSRKIRKFRTDKFDT